MINELIGRVFAARDITHRAHWRTSSFAQHTALGEFYEALPDQIDTIVETYQGLGTLVDPDIIKADDAPDLLNWLKDEADWIEANRELISIGSNSLSNLVDGLTATYLHVIYKLERLA